MTYDQQHTITPPPELVQKWMSEFNGSLTWPGELALHIVVHAAQWGADQELEACCEWLDGVGDLKQQLRADRRPKPSSLKEQALKEMDKLDEQWEVLPIELDSLDILRRALEALPDDL